VTSSTKGARGATFASLRTRNFRLFFVGQFISQIGNWLTMVALILFTLKLTHNSGIAAGAMTAAEFAPMLLLGAWAGLLADRSDKRRLLVIVEFFAMAESFTLAVLAATGTPPLWLLYSVAFLGGVATAFDNPTRRSFVVEMVPEEQLTNAVSLNTAIMTGARVVGPALAGLLITTVGFTWCFGLDGLSYIAVIVGLMMMRKRELRPSPMVERAKGQVRAGFRYVAKVPDLWISLTMMTIVGTLAFNFQVVMPLFVSKSLGGGDTLYTVLFSFLSIGSLLGALAVARRTVVHLSHVTIASAAYAVTMFAMALAPNLAAAFPIGFCIGISSVMFLTASSALVNLRAAPEMRGRVLALQGIVFIGSTPIGGPITGFVCDVFGPRAGWVLGGASCVVACALGIVLPRRLAARQAHAKEAAILQPV
jgi:MFS family permease